MIDILFLICWWTLLIILPAISVYYKAFWYSLIIFLVMIAGGVVAHYYYRDIYPLGTIREDIIVRVGPHETYGACGMFKAQDNVVICDTRDTWKQVQKIKSVVRGWIPQDYVAIDLP